MWNISVVRWDAPVSGYPFSRTGPSLPRLLYHRYGESFTFAAPPASSLLLHSTASCFYSVSLYHVWLLHFVFSTCTHFCLPYCPATKWGWKRQWNFNFCFSFSYISSKKIEWDSNMHPKTSPHSHTYSISFSCYNSLLHRFLASLSMAIFGSVTTLVQTVVIRVGIKKYGDCSPGCRSRHYRVFSKNGTGREGITSKFWHEERLRDPLTFA